MSELRINLKGIGSIFRKKIKRKGKEYISPIWHVSFYHGGKYHFKSSGEVDETKATKFLKQEIESLGLGIVRAVEGRLKFEELLDMVETEYTLEGKAGLKNLPSYKNHLSGFFRGWKASRIDVSAINKYKAKRQNEGAKNSTINRELACLSRAFTLAVEDKKLHHQPKIKKLKEDNVRTGFLDPDDFEQLKSLLPEYLRDPMEFLYLSGWRRGKMQDLSWSNVSADEIRLPDTETNKKAPRLLPLDGELAEIISRAKRNRRLGCPLVFHKEGRKLGNFRKVWWKVCVEAGLGKIVVKDGKKKYQGLNVHDFRRSVVRNLTRSGVQEKTAMEVTGHKTRAVFDRYNIIDRKDLLEAQKKMDLYRRMMLEQSKKV